MSRRGRYRQVRVRTDDALPLGAGVATGVGSLPGTDPREAAAVVAGELADLPHLAELPARGPGADLVGRAVAVLVDLHADVQPAGWRLVDRPGLDERRALSYLGHDLDELEAACSGLAGPVKVQLCGPWTLAANLRLPRGEPVLSDAGAVRDVVASLAEGVAAHVAEVRRRVPTTSAVVLQLDEPSLPAVLAGQVRSFSGMRRFDPVPPAAAEDALRTLVEAAAVPVVVHCCAPAPPLGLLRLSGAAGVSVDVSLLGEAAVLDELGEALEAGIRLFAGLVPTVGDLSDPAATVAPVRRLWGRLGLPAEGLRSVVVTPSCGLAGASPAYAREALRLAREGARQLAEDPASPGPGSPGPEEEQ